MVNDQSDGEGTLRAELEAARQRIAELEGMLGWDSACSPSYLNALGVPVFVKDESHRFIYVNKSFCKAMNLPAAHFLGKTDADFYPGTEVEVFLAVDDRVLATGETISNEEQVTWGEEPHPVCTVKSRWTDPASGKHYVVGVIHDLTERDASRRAMHESEERLALIMDTVAEAVVLQDAAGRIVFWNKGAERLFGVSGAEALNSTFESRDWGTLHADGRPMPGSEHPSIHTLRTGEPVRDCVIGIVSKTGHTRWALVNTRPVPGKRKDKPRAVVISCLDVTESRIAEQSLRDSEEKNHALASATFEAIFISDKGVCIETNRAASEMFGYSYDELIGIFGTDVISEDTKHIVRENMLAGYEEPYEAVGLRKDGSRFPAEFQGRMFLYKGRPVRVTAVRDLTERKKAERELAESERKYRLLAENVEDVIFVTDNNLNFSYVSPGVVRLRGITPEEALQEKPEQAMTPASVEVIQKARLARMAAEARGDLGLVNRMELEMYRKDGSTVWVEVLTRGMRDEQGRTVGLVGLARNIDARKQMENQLVAAKEAAEAASRAKSEFLANVSHEIRTPLNGMLGMLQLLQNADLDSDSAEMIRTSLDCGRSLVSIINDILDLSQIEAGAVRLYYRGFDLSRTLHSVKSVFEHQAASRGLRLFTEVAPGTPMQLHGDEGRLRQVLFNLVGNALKFTEQGSVGVEVQALSSLGTGHDIRLLFRVSDTGIGIPDDKVDDVFDAFTQVDGSYTRRYSGTGLGLSIVRRLVGLMNGNLCVDSEEGRGTDIYLALCFSPARTMAAVSSPEIAPQPRRRLRVVLAEDDRIGRIAVSRLLEKLGHECVAVECGREAVQAVLGGCFDCVLMDIQMPDMNGLDAVRIIREQYSGECAVPAMLALTGHAMSGDREEFLAAGMDGYLAKPVSLDDLQQALDAVAVRRPKRS